MARAAWFPRSLAGQRAMLANVGAKIAIYEAALGLTPAAVARIELICTWCVAIIDFTSEAKATMEAIFEWREVVFEEGPINGPAPGLPPFPAYFPALALTTGLFDEFRKFVELVKASPGYTLVIGEDLMIVGTEKVPDNLADLKPSITVTAMPDFAIRITGSMQGYSQMRIEWQKLGDTVWNLVTFISNLPAEVPVSPTVPGEAEKGRIRARFLVKNVIVGQYSDDVPVTIS